MNEKARYRISLRITHPNIRSIEISSRLGLEPDFSYTAGDRRLTPKGNEIGGIRKESFWCHELRSDDLTFELAISNLSQQLAKSKGFLDSLSSTGGHLEYFIGWFSAENSGFVLEGGLLRLLADLRISLAFDVYVGP
ncbi:DUF4279 domain-containing protein [Stenotrophomonas nematodicola]|uniref:DUF4279 domain-containing protein n=1 Tax=Stenotrophomonas nematodicola TaxID=2656746 RepID=A0ABW7D311_9GAMM